MRVFEDFDFRDSLSPSVLPTEIMLVIGPPCSGKSTYVAQNKKAEDLVFDFDAVAQAITGSAPQHGDWPAGVRAFVLALRDAFIAKAQRGRWVNRVWLIACTEKGLLTVRAKVIPLKTPRAVCLARADERGPGIRRMAEEWFERHS